MNAVRKLALGTVQFGMPYGIANSTGKVSAEAVTAILEGAWAAGLDTLDTAAGYGDSEAVLGEAGVGVWKIVTKLPPLAEDKALSTDQVVEAVRSSLARLRVPSIYGLLLHRPTDLLGRNGAAMMAGLKQVKAEGMVEKLGYSIYSPAELPALCDVMPADLIQSPYNVFDQRLKTSGWMNRLHDLGTEIHTRSAFLQGLLLMPSDQRPSKFSRWTGPFAAWDRTVEENHAALQTALGFALAEPQIARVVVGVDSLLQFKEIAGAAHDVPSASLDHLAVNDEDLINPSRWSAL